MSAIRTMRTVISAVVTPDEVLAYAKGKGIRAEKEKDGSVEINSTKFSFWFQPKNVKWHVRIEATDDPDDSDEEVTADPVKFIAKFLGAGVPGGEHFEKMSSSPVETARLLRHLATRVDVEALGPRGLRAVLRRAAIMPQADLLRRVLAAVCRTAAGQGAALEEVKKLESEMKRKGWRVEEGETDAGAPQLKVDVSGIYEAFVRAESIPYEYELNVIGFSDLAEKGVTEDPISAIRKYVKSPSVEEAMKQLEFETSKTEMAPEGKDSDEQGPGDFEVSRKGIHPDRGDAEKTMPAGKPKPEEFRDDQTVAPKKAK